MFDPPGLSRRQFGTLLGAGAALAWSGSALAEPNTPKPYRKAVKIGMVDVPGGLLEKFKVLAELGFDGIELDSPNSWSRDEVLRARDESGILIHGVVDSVHWNQTLSHPDAKVRAAGVQGLETAIRDSKAYGGTSVLLVPAVVNKDATYDEAWQRSHEELRKVLPLAEELGMDVLFENVWNNFLTSPQETARYIDELECPRVGAYFDVGNAVRYSPPATWIPVLGKRIKKLDIKEYKLGLVKNGRVFDGFAAELLEGDCDWPAVLNELRKIGYEGWGTAEIPGGGRDRLAEIAQRMNKIFAS